MLRGLAGVVSLCGLVFAANAEVLSITVDAGASWRMKPGLAEEYRSFLDARLQDLKAKVPELYWPEMTASAQLPEVFLSAFYPVPPKYRNRQMQCALLERIRGEVSGTEAAELSDLTQSGKVCMPGDLPQSQWASWTERMARFFWLGKWISGGDERLSLEDLIIKNIGAANYRRPEIHIATKLDFDGYAWGYSPTEIALFEDDPILSKYYQIAKTYDPNSEAPFSNLGPQIEQGLQQNPYGLGGTFQPGSKIYFSRAWAPSDLVELLAHEYGHVFHGEQDANLTWIPQERVLRIYSNRVHDEAVAEAFAWLLLRELYSTYPEIEFFHIGKQRVFLEKRSEDPHVVGAAAFYTRLHSDYESSITDLAALARSTDFDAYLSKAGVWQLEKTSAPMSYSFRAEYDVRPGSGRYAR